MKKRVFSGIQPTGGIHIGNYLAAIRVWTGLQEECDCFFSVVDLHAVTVPHDPATLREKTRETAGVLIAAGIDPSRSAIFTQSRIPAHAEMTWVMNCTIPMGWLLCMTQLKEKSSRQREQVSAGLFDYPALMAADILLYHADLVPVGSDQKQHVELARDAAQRFNSLYGRTLTLPDALIPSRGGRIMSLSDPSRKMSKTGEARAVGVLDTPDEIRGKVMGAVTDSRTDIRFDETRPGILNLLTIYELFTGQRPEDIVRRFEGKSYAAFKGELSDAVIAGLAPLQSRYRELRQDPGHLDRLLDQGLAKARPVAEHTITTVKNRMGLG